MVDFSKRADYFDLPFWDVFFTSQEDAQHFTHDCEGLGLEAKAFDCDDRHRFGVTVVCLPQDAEAFADLAKDWPLPAVQKYVPTWESVGGGMMAFAR